MMKNTISVVTDPLSGKRLLNKSEFCNYIGLGHTKAEKWAIEHGVVRHIGRRVLYDRVAVDKAIDENTGDKDRFIDLKDGIYPFTVKSVRKEIKTAKTGRGVPVVNVTLSINGGKQGVTSLVYSFWLFKKNAWIISDFFVSIGVMKSGEKGFRMHWDDLAGKKGFVELYHQEYEKDDGTKGTILNVKRFKRQEA
jgi:hypothetical protein